MNGEYEAPEIPSLISSYEPMGAEMTSRKTEHDPDNGRDPGDQWPCAVSGEWAGRQHLQGYPGPGEGGDTIRLHS